jgi:hypothetical protein
VLDTQGNILAFNDDHGTALPDLWPSDSVIANLALAGPGSYTVRVFSQSGIDVGNVEVTVETIDGVGSVETIRGYLPIGARHAHTFEAEAGDALTVIAGDTSGTLNPLITLRDSSGNVLAWAEAQPAPETGLRVAQLDDFVLPADGEYTIELIGADVSEGAFEMSIELEEPPV